MPEIAGAICFRTDPIPSLTTPLESERNKFKRLTNDHTVANNG